MYKVLIIDDEEPSRDAIKILGDWDSLGVDSVLEAINGKMGMELVRAERPDIVLVDMRMPEMNGTEFLKLVTQEFPDLVRIVISGYSDFEYAKQAIQSNAADYLLKPVNKTELNVVLQKAIDSLKVKRKKETESIDANISLNMSLPKLKEKILMSIIEQTVNRHTNQEQLEMIFPDNKNNSFGIALLRIMNLEEIKQKRFNQESDLLYFAITNVINEVGSDNFQCFSFVNPKAKREIIITFTYEGVFPDEIKSLSISFMKRVVRKLNELFGIEVIAGIGDISSDAFELSVSYRTAEAILNSVNLIDLKEAIFIYVLHKDSFESHSITNRMSLIKSALEDSNQSTITNILYEYTHKIKKSGYFNIGNADRSLLEFFILLQDIAIEFGVQQKELSNDYEAALLTQGTTLDYTSFEQFEQVLFHILHYYSDKIKSSIKSSKNFNVNDIKEYIHNHYFETIKISLFTQKYFLSREYLMKLFKQEFGYGIHEYIQKVRMEKAKELLNDSNLKIQTISEMLGYSDKNYFSKAFKNYYQISPSDSRLNQGQIEPE
ncbi:response regulator [Paenibacillus psychroresistens]|uniref:Response regulator n=1 Tax=Paenibacillus psychroresistens TaxID=1778678 RepID=A0A6B8RK92_9BACL|nr:response regulator [Paenibacillus psychroresistens]QGQ96459.1 response regulator [Paenibacillus psychroresistens]